MSHRTQITLTDEQYATLKRESRRTGVSLAELVRRAIVREYSAKRRIDDRALDESFGAWKDRDFDGAEYVERIRRPGLGRRLGL
jgi:predicted CopG family antitoxin